MDLTNKTYTIWISAGAWTERYYRDAEGWVKQSARGRTFRATAEQVLNHLLPALAGLKPGLRVRVEHREPRRPASAKKRTGQAGRRCRRRPRP